MGNINLPGFANKEVAEVQKEGSTAGKPMQAGTNYSHTHWLGLLLSKWIFTFLIFDTATATQGQRTSLKEGEVN